MFKVAGNSGIAGIAGIGGIAGVVGVVGVYVSVWVDAHVVGAVWAAGGHGEGAPVVFGDGGSDVHGLPMCVLSWW